MNDLVPHQGLAAPACEELYPIREVSRVTGINPVTLRAWERRYGLVIPSRTESGHRLYTLADIERVREILGWIERGVAVSKVAGLLAQMPVQAERPRPVDDAPELVQWRAHLHRAAEGFDESALERVYGQVFAAYPLATVFQDILTPVWTQLLHARQEAGGQSRWAFFDAYLCARVHQRLHLSRQGQGINVLLAPMLAQSPAYLLGVAGLLLGSVDVHVQVLPPGQPLEELSLVCEQRRPEALVLYGSTAPEPDLSQRLVRLAAALPCPLLLAGETSEWIQNELTNSPVACLGGQGIWMQRRLLQFLAGHLDT